MAKGSREGGLCLYLDSSILIRALEDPEARRFLEECCARHRCVVSSVHGLEGWKDETLAAVEALLEGLGVERLEVDLDALVVEADQLVEERGWSPGRRLDLMHLLAASTLGCQGIVAVDRFVRRRAREYGFLYLNPYTGCPRGWAGSTRSGGGRGTRRGYS